MYNKQAMSDVHGHCRWLVNNAQAMRGYAAPAP